MRHEELRDTKVGNPGMPYCFWLSSAALDMPFYREVLHNLAQKKK
jgi:hypothetical protein